MIKHPISPKRRFTAFLLCWLLGILGAHCFYAGHKKTGKGYIMLTLSILGWPIVFTYFLIDMYLILSGKYPDSNGARIVTW